MFFICFLQNYFFMQADARGSVSLALAQIQNNLTCTRPCCSRPVSEIDGCMACHCPDCRVYFCILCDTVLRDGREEVAGHQDRAHAHVIECSKATFHLDGGMLFLYQHPQGIEGAKKALRDHFAHRLLMKFQDICGNQVIPFRSPFGE